MKEFSYPSILNEEDKKLNKSDFLDPVNLMRSVKSKKRNKKFKKDLQK